MGARFELPLRSPRAPFFFLCVITLLQMAATWVYSATLHYSFKTSAFDVGMFEQGLFRLTHGAGLSITIVPPWVEQSWFNLHFSPILYGLAPLYYLWPDAMMFRTLNVFLLASAAPVLFFCVRKMTGSSWLACVMAASYVLHPLVVNAAVWDFHEVSFAPVIFSLAYLALLHRHRAGFMAACVALLAVKEHYALAVLGFGLLWGMAHGDYRFGAKIMVMALLAGIAVAIFMYLHNGGQHIMVQGEDSRYGWLLSPTWQDIGAMMAQTLLYAALLGLAWFHLPLWAPAWLLPGMADFATNTLSANGMMTSVYTYYSAPLIPVLVIGASAGLMRAIRNNPRLTYKDAILVVPLLGVGLHVMLSVLPYRNDNFWELSAPQLGYKPADKQALEKVHALVGKTEVLSAQQNVGAHVGGRMELYHFPQTLGGGRWLLLRLDTPYHRRLTGFGSPFGVACEDYVQSVRDVARDRHWQVAYWQKPWLLLQKHDLPAKAGIENSLQEPLATLEAQCDALRRGKNKP